MTPFSDAEYLGAPPKVGGDLAPSRLDELRKRYEENPRRFFAPFANELRKSGDLDQAISLCQEHLEAQPGNMNGHVVYGQALFDAGRYPEAEATFTTALTLDPENLIVLRHLGDIARLSNDGARALEWYARVLDADPRNDEILSFMAEVKATIADDAADSAASAPMADGTPVVPIQAVAANDAPTNEISPVRPSKDDLTPVAPVETVPVKRPSVSLIDMDLDFSSGVATPMDTPASPPPPPPVMPSGNIELSGFSFGDAESQQAEPHAAAPVEGSPDLQIDSAVGWDMGNVDLDAGADAGHGDAAEPADATPQVFVTETMAELYLQQGFREEALQVYRQLSEMNPHDESLKERIHSLEEGGRSSVSFERVVEAEPDFAPGTDSLIEMSAPATPEPEAEPETQPEADAKAEPEAQPEADAKAEAEAEPEPASAPEAMSIEDLAFSDTPSVSMSAPAVTTARSFFASLAQRRPLRSDGTAPAGIVAVEAAEPASPTRGNGSVDALFGSATDGTDDAMAQALATAVGVVDAQASVRGRPTKAAVSEFSLDSVFRGETAMRTSGPTARQSEVLKFDQFFAPNEGAPAQAPAPDAAPPAPAAPADDAQFQSWLQGLKDK